MSIRAEAVSRKRFDAMFDYHVHTSLCNHADGSMEAYVRAAVAKGLEAICFLDHLTFQEGGRSNAMLPREVPMYVDAARRLARCYRDRITVRVGLEIDFSPRHADRCAEIVETFDFDVVGSSIHFLDGVDVVSRGSAWARGERDAEAVYAAYIDTLETMLEYDYFDMVCHLDLPKKFGRRPMPAANRRFDDCLQTIGRRGLAIELNTSGFDYPVEEAFPAPDLLTRCAQLGIPVLTGSDAHAPEAVGRGFDRARDLLRDAGYRHLTGFSHRKKETAPL